MGLFCEVCNISVSSERNMQDHLKGRKHQKVLQSRHQQEELSSRTVFIRGFDPNIEEGVLDTFLENTIGSINKVYLNKDKGHFALVEFRSKESAQKALSKPNISFRGHQLRVKPRTTKTNKKNVAQIKEARKAKKEQRKSEQESKAKSDHEMLMTLLNENELISDQMLTLQRELELTNEDTELRHSVQTELECLFSAFITGCELHQFGSSANGFGVRGCDMDLYLELNLDKPPPTQRESKPQHPYPQPYLQDLPGVRFTQGQVDRESLGQLSLQDRIKVLSRILCATGKYSQILTILGARCPLAKFVHTASGISCDLTINNRLSLRNTRLLQFYAQIDPRIRTLMYVVRYWGKLRKIAGNPTSGPRLTNYALTLLVLVYLVNTQPPLVPSVEDMATRTDEKVTLDGWDCSFTEDTSMLPPSANNTSTLPELLCGFFTFWAHYDFTNKVVVTRTGQGMSREDFLEAMEQEPRLQAFKMTALCVQDPFVLDHNITGNVNPKVKDLLVDELQRAATMCSSKAYLSKQEDGSTWGLMLLLSEDADPESENKASSRLSGDQDQGMSEVTEVKEGENMEKCSQDLTNAYRFQVQRKDRDQQASSSSSSSQSSANREWCCNTIKLVEKILQEILYCDVTVLGSDDKSCNLEHITKETESSGSPCKAESAVPCKKIKLDSSCSSNEGLDIHNGDRSSLGPVSYEKLAVHGAATMHTQTAVDKGDNGPNIEYTGQSGGSHTGIKETRKSLKRAIEANDSTHLDDLTDDSLKSMTHLLLFTSCRRMWLGRDFVEGNVPRTDDIFQKEVSKSQAMASEPMCAHYGKIEFHLQMTWSEDSSGDGIYLHLIPTNKNEDFTLFYSYFENLVKRLTDQIV